MSLPKTSAAYPPQFLRAVETAFSTGEITILHAKPLALRLQLNGLRGALRREGKADIIDSVSFHLRTDPPALIIRARDQSFDARAVESALADIGQPKQPNNPLDDPSRPALFDADTALDRILNRSADNA